MGYITGATGDTVEAIAYLTETGRKYLFNESNNRFDSSGNDLFQIVKFALSDSDTNYTVDESHLLIVGQVPGVTGDKASVNSCLKTTSDYVQSNLISYVFDEKPVDTDEIEYTSGLGEEKLSISVHDLNTTTEKP